jgi:hypothetical protein
MDDHGQMMVLELVIFTALIFLSLIFIYQLSPSSVLNDKYSNNLKIDADNALNSIYNSAPPVTYRGYPSNKLAHYFIANDYIGFTTDINSRLPTSVLFNIYISNGVDTRFWCNAFGDNTTKLIPHDPVTICHYIISIHPMQLTEFDEVYINAHRSILCDIFDIDASTTYDVTVELWYE